MRSQALHLATSLRVHTKKKLPLIHSRTITAKSNNRRSPSLHRVESVSDQNVLSSEFPDSPLPTTPVTPFVFREATKWQDKIATECGLTGRNYTYGKLVDALMRWGGMLQQTFSNEENPHTVAILAPNTPEYPIFYYGSIAVGATVTTINPASKPEEVAGQLSDSGATLLVVESGLEGLADSALRCLNRDIPVVVNGPSTTGRTNIRNIFTDPSIRFASDVDIKGDTVAVIPYSSGTTGKPKGVCIAHSAIAYNLGMYQNPHTFNLTKAEGEHQDVLSGLLPFYHIYGMMVIMCSGICNGAKIVTMPRFDPINYNGMIKKHKVSVLHTVPPLLQFLVSSPAVSSDDLASIHSLMCAAAPVPLAAASALKDKAPNPIFFQEGFGMTESLCTHMTPRGEERLGTCGKLVPHARAKVVDLDTGVALPPGTPGELCLQSPAMMKGYHNNPDATRETIDEDGWLYTGDVATYDENGYFAIVDRIKELIKVKGLQVSPSELEDILLHHPQVLDVGVVGVEDERCGEVPRAYVVCQENVTEEDLHSFIESQVAPYKQLAGGIKFVKELPKNPTGKLLRRELKKMAQQE